MNFTYLLEEFEVKTNRAAEWVVSMRLIVLFAVTCVFLGEILQSIKFCRHKNASIEFPVNAC